MTKQEANQQRSVEAFMARKAEFDALLAELTQASVEHFGAAPTRCSGVRRSGSPTPPQS